MLNSDIVARVGQLAVERLEALNVAREHALADTRQITRHAANAIRAAHRGDFPQSELLLIEAQTRHRALHDDLRDYPSLYWSGYVQDAQKEYVEARVTVAVMTGTGLPEPSDLGVTDAVYLNGLGEAAGELRRHALDSMRRGQLDRAEYLLGVMDDIYGVLVVVDFPDAVTGGLRRTTDMVRGVLERTRGDLTLALRQHELAQVLTRARQLAQTEEES